jgi:crossover junction endodeoxyribonuclease RusA
VIFTLPEPPSANRYWRVFRGRAVTSAEARAYKKKVAVLLHGTRPLKGDVCVRVEWHRGRKSGDLDNRLKCALDSLKGLAFKDDKQVVTIYAFRFEDKQNPRIVVVINNA